MWVDQYAMFYNKKIVFDKDHIGRYFEIKTNNNEFTADPIIQDIEF
jgi:hypothetical protein